MRERVTRAALAVLEKHTPPRLKSLQLQILMNATAAGFDRPGRMIAHLPWDKALETYAAYTADCVSAGGYDRRRLWRSARRLGRRIRRISGLSGKDDLERLVFYLYGNIGIRMTGQLPGEITIPACYFSRVYTPEQCRVMSLMDWGVISGICGGGRLIFTERLTQGCGRCRARLVKRKH